MASLAHQVERAAVRHGLPGRLVVALAHAVSQLRADTCYDPNYDARYVTPSVVWQRHPEYLTDGPTAHDWFVYHPAHRTERRADQDYTFVAQTTLATQYGPLMLYYPEAIKAGYIDDPVYLQHDLEVPIGVLEQEVAWAAHRVPDEPRALRVGIARYNGHHAGNMDPDCLTNIDTLRAVEASYRILFGCAFWTRI